MAPTHRGIGTCLVRRWNLLHAGHSPSTDPVGSRSR
jgi:hypothetical protein